LELLKGIDNYNFETNFFNTDSKFIDNKFYLRLTKNLSVVNSFNEEKEFPSNNLNKEAIINNLKKELIN